MVNTKLKLFQDILARHKECGHYIDFKGWQLHKWNYYSYSKEHIVADNLFVYGIVPVSFIDITPYGDVECAGCNTIHKMSTNMHYNVDIKLIYCSDCNIRMSRKTSFELKCSSLLDIDAFQYLPIHNIICTSWSNKSEMLRTAAVNVQDMQEYWKDIPCIMHKNGALPSACYVRFMARRAIKKWRDTITKRKVAYILYKCIPNLDAVTAKALAERSIT